MNISLKYTRRFVRALNQNPFCHINLTNTFDPAERRSGDYHDHVGEAALALGRIGEYPGEEYDHDEARDYLAAYLFDNTAATGDDLEKWAERNPEIWGNDFGDEMFIEPRAFGLDEERRAALIPNGIIAAHWRRVVNRLEAEAGIGLEQRTYCIDD